MNTDAAGRGVTERTAGAGKAEKPLEFPLDRRLQIARFRRFLRWLLVPFFVFGPIDVAQYVLYDDWQSGALGAIILLLIPVFLWNIRELDRGRLELAVTVTIVSLLVPATIIVFLRPYLHHVLAVGCLLAVSVALPLLPPKRIRSLSFLAWANAILIVVLATTVLPPSSSVPESLQRPLAALAFVVVLGLVFLTNWLYSSRLQDLVVSEARGRQDLSAANEKLRAVDEARTRFMGTTAHELFNPLTPIRIQLHLLQAQGSAPLAESQRVAIEVMERNVLRLQRLAEELLDAGRAAAGKMRLERSPHRLSPVVEHAVLAHGPMAEELRIHLATDIRADPEAPVDEARVTQILNNLIGNAFKFTPQGGTVTVGLDENGADAVLFVKDTGIGMEPSELPKLFQPFSQLPSTEGAREGSGLGLFIARTIAEGHGGSISAMSGGPGRGSMFKVRLPLAAPSSSPVASAQGASPEAGVAASA